MSDYLWDKQGPPDPEVERLEMLLRPLAYRAQGARPYHRRGRRAWVWASAVLAISAAFALIRWRAPAPRSAAPLIATGTSGVRIRIGDLGTVDLRAGARARILESGPQQHRLQLERGALEARIHAPARVFVIETPRARITDLGCAFTLTVDDSGQGTLTVSEGKVAISPDGAPEIVVSAGSSSDLTGVLIAHEPAAAPRSPAPLHQPAPPRQPAPLHPAAPEHPRAPLRRASPKHPTPKAKTAAPAAPKSAVPTAPVSKGKVTKPADATSKPGVRLDHDALKDLERSMH